MPNPNVISLAQDFVVAARVPNFRSLAMNLHQGGLAP